jgi:hypothetical protein
MAGPVKLTDVCGKTESDRKIFPITDRRYRELAKDGIVPPVIDGKIEFIPAVKQFMEYQKKQIEGYGSLSLADERTEGQRLKNELLRNEVEVEKGRLIPKSEVLQEFLKRIYVIKSDLLSIEKRLPVNSKEREIVKKSVRQMLTNYSKGTGVLRGNKNPKK